MEAVGDGTNAIERATKQGSEITKCARAGGKAFKVGIVNTRGNPRLVRAARRVRARHHVVAAQLDDPLVLLALLVKDIAEDATLFYAIVLAGRAQLIKHAARHECRGHDFGGGVIELLPGVKAEVLEHTNVLEAGIFLKVLDA